MESTRDFAKSINKIIHKKIDKRIQKRIHKKILKGFNKGFHNIKFSQDISLRKIQQESFRENSQVDSEEGDFIETNS